ncbi:hypothetical protein [Clostridium sp.]|jgi:hypothetical protein|uniref:hypothetical protein n=1 Tax=Clostridium sp. TaxID=1506 RepID=UPI003EE86802
MDNRYVRFSKDFMYVENDRRDKVDIPTYIALSFKRHRYDKEDKVIQKECVECLKWFNILKLEENQLIDTHKEEEIYLRKGKSGYANRCNYCTANGKVATSGSTGSDKKEIDYKTKEKNDKYSLYLRPSNKKFLVFLAATKGITVADALNEIIEKEIKNTDIDKLIENMKKIYKN